MLYPLSYGGKMLEIMLFYWRGRISYTSRELHTSQLPALVAKTKATPFQHSTKELRHDS